MPGCPPRTPGRWYNQVMGTSDLEMYEVVADQPDGEALPQPRHRWHDVDRMLLATAILWGLAAAGAIVAPFLRLVGVQQTFRPDGTITTIASSYRVDGWGRSGASSSDGVVASFGHEPRYGIATCACAALLLAAIALLVVNRATWQRRAAGGTAVAATAVLAGVIAAGWLQLEALLSRFPSSSDAPFGAVPTYETAVGPCLLVGLVAVGCGAAGVVTWQVRTRRSA